MGDSLIYWNACGIHNVFGSPCFGFWFDMRTGLAYYIACAGWFPSQPDFLHFLYAIKIRARTLTIWLAYKTSEPYFWAWCRTRKWVFSFVRRFTHTFSVLLFTDPLKAIVSGNFLWLQMILNDRAWISDIPLSFFSFTFSYCFWSFRQVKL